MYWVEGSPKKSTRYKFQSANSGGIEIMPGHHGCPFTFPQIIYCQFNSNSAYFFVFSVIPILPKLVQQNYAQYSTHVIKHTWAKFQAAISQNYYFETPGGFYEDPPFCSFRIGYQLGLSTIKAVQQVSWALGDDLALALKSCCHGIYPDFLFNILLKQDLSHMSQQGKDQAIPEPEGEPRKLVKVDKTALEQLKQHSTVVADTGEFNLIEKFKPQDSTTNPTLILMASQKPEFKPMIAASVDFAVKNFNKYLGKGKQKKDTTPAAWEDLSEEDRENLIDLAFDHIAVSFGVKILEFVPGYVSTEVDAKLSFNKTETVNRGKRIIELYKESDVKSDRILIKVAATWEGIKAAEALKKAKINCNCTLIFHKIQAIACAQSKLFLISPFVGRILDWFKNAEKKDSYEPSQDPGVKSVTEIYNYFKKYGYQTIVMGASFRNTAEIKQLSGCDRLTISPKLLEELQEDKGEVPVKLDPKKAEELQIPQVFINEATFRYEMNKSKMGTDLLSAGIRKFQEDGDKLKEMIKQAIGQYFKKE